MEGSYELLLQLKKNHDLFLISNTNNFEILKPEWKIEIFFEKIFYSYKTNCLKPTKKSILQVYKNHQFKPEECLFIDDKIENVIVAKSHGLQTIHFQNMKMLKEELKQKNLI